MSVTMGIIFPLRFANAFRAFLTSLTFDHNITAEKFSNLLNKSKSNPKIIQAILPEALTVFSWILACSIDGPKHKITPFG